MSCSHWFGLGTGEHPVEASRGGGQAGQGEGVSPLGAAPSALAPTPFNGAVLHTIQWTESKGDLNLFQAISPFVLLNS